MAAPTPRVAAVKPEPKYPEPIQVPPSTVAPAVVLPAPDLDEIDPILSEWAKVAVQKRRGNFVPAGELRNQFNAYRALNSPAPMDKGMTGVVVAATFVRARRAADYLAARGLNVRRRLAA